MFGALFLMASSTIRPGFITRATLVTAQLGAAFVFGVLVSIFTDVARQ